MRIAINQPYFLPYLGYFQLIASSDVFVVYEHVRYTRKSWINRNRLQGKAVAPYHITVPVTKSKGTGLISDTLLTKDASKEMARLLRQIKADYSKAPFFTENYNWTNEMLTCAPYDNIHQFNAHCLARICTKLGIKTQLSLQNDHIQIEHRLMQEADKHLRMRERIRLLADHFGADTYINLPGGRTLYNRQEFARFGLKLEFLNQPRYQYPQFNKPFIPNLSVLDTIFHCGLEKTSGMVHNFSIEA